MAAESITTTRWRLKKNYVFVENYDLDNLNPIHPIHNHPIGSAFIMRREARPHKYIQMDQVAAFIMRFVIMGVDTMNLLPEIVKSEYGLPSLQDAKTRINNVLTKMQKYLDPWKKVRDLLPESYSEEKDWNDDNYTLDNSMHSIGPGFIKGPF
jgi:hypothetical protein